MNEEYKSEQIIIRITAAEKAAGVALAERCGMTLSDLVRRLLANAEAEPVVGYQVKTPRINAKPAPAQERVRALS